MTVRDLIARAGRTALTGGFDVLPNRLKWEVMAYAPTRYLNIVPVETEAEFAESGREAVDEIVGRLADYDESFRVQGSTILEIGVGPGRLLVPFGDRGADLHGVDISRKNLAKAERYAREHDLDPALERSKSGLPAFGRQFDLIYSVLVFQHVRRRTAIRYLTDARAALAPGGIVYVTFANLADDEYRHTYVTEGLEKTYSFRMRYYTASEVRLLLDELGYTDVAVVDAGPQIVAMARG